MNSDIKSRFDAVYQLYQSAWNRFNDRRGFEIKISISIWTALALFIVSVINITSFPKIPGNIGTLIFLGLLIVFLHSLWCYALGKANNIDRNIAFHHEKLLLTLVDNNYNETLKCELTQSQKDMGKIYHKSYILQIGITVILVASIVLLAFNKMDVPKNISGNYELKKIELEIKKMELEIQKLHIELCILKPKHDSLNATDISKL